PEFEAQREKYIFPLLWQAWDMFKEQTATNETNQRVLERKFYESLVMKGPVNPDLETHQISFDAPSADLQLRAYLFYLFRYYHDVVFDNATIGDLKSWEWAEPLAFLSSGLFITIFLSFNYDCI